MALLNKGKNLIANGAMDFWQRNTSFAAVATNTYTADRWQYTKSGTMVHTIARDTDVPTSTQSNFFFPYSLKATLTTPQASIGATEFSAISQKIEGAIVAPTYGKTITVSFWVKATLVGTYAVAFRNSANDRSLVRTYTISTTNTWEKKTLTLDMDVSGTWLTDSGIGLQMSFVLAAGTTLQASSLDTWLTGNFLSHSSAVNGVQSGATDLRVTGVQFEQSHEASNFERLNGNTANELIFCQRYYTRYPQINNATSTYLAAGRMGASSNGDVTFQLSPMRAAPTVTTSGTFGVDDGGTSSAVSVAINTSSPNSAGLRVIGTGLTQGRGIIFYATTNSFVGFDSEL